jgi:hypothetical protein
MADLQVCYFCGVGPDSSLGEYAVVPPALDPDEDQQASVVLCPDCRQKLTTVMEPVVEAAGAHTGGGSDSDDAAGGPGAAGGSDTDAAAGGGPRSPGGGSDAADGRTGRPSGDPAPGSPDSGPAADDDPLAGPGSTADDDEAARGSTADDDVTVEDAGDSDPVSADDGGTRPADRPDDPSPEPTEPDEDAPPRDQPHADDELVGRNNEAYNKTLRLLQNREFPVERHEIEQVAANAYQLDPQEVSDAIDALIRKGLLTQEGAQLVRPG